MGNPYWHVYFLKSITTDFLYIGSTNSRGRQLEEHNEGKVQSIKVYRRFKMIAFIVREIERKAREPEKYFKTGSWKQY